MASHLFSGEKLKAIPSLLNQELQELREASGSLRGSNGLDCNLSETPTIKHVLLRTFHIQASFINSERFFIQTGNDGFLIKFLASDSGTEPPSHLKHEYEVRDIITRICSEKQN